jgi:hypothetical protein
MKVRHFLLIFLLIMSCCSVVSATDTSSYYSNYKTITIDHTKVAANLTNFPMLVTLVDDTDIGAKAQSNGYDLYFKSASNVPLAYERESFAIADGKCNALIWVKVPDLSSTADTEIRLYYGNASIGDGQNKTGVWDNGYNDVYHLSETGAGTAGDYKDSTSNVHHSTNTAGQPTKVTGIIGNGQSFDGSTKYIEIGKDLYNSQTNGTISAWVKIPALLSNTSAQTIFSLGSADNSNGLWYLGIYGTSASNTRLRVGHNYPSLTALYGDTDIQANTWCYVTLLSNETILPASRNAVYPSVDGTMLLGENIVYDDVTKKYWWVFENRSTGTSYVNLAYANSITGVWTQQTGNVAMGTSPFIKKFDGKWYIYTGNYTTGNVQAVNSTSVNTGYGNPIVVIPKGSAGTWDANRVLEVSVVNESGTYRMLFMGEDVPDGYEKVGYAYSTSPDKDFVKYEGNPVLSGNTSIYDTGLDRAADPFIFTKVPSDGLYYIGVTETRVGKDSWNVGLFTTTNFINYTRISPVPILQANSSSPYDNRATFRGDITNVNGTYYQSYTMKNSASVYRLGLAKFNFDSLVNVGWVEYVNGVPQTLTIAEGLNKGLWFNSFGKNLRYDIGTLRRNSGNIGYFNGTLDEVRLSNVVRSSSWISTEYNNQNSPATFYALGAESSDLHLKPIPAENCIKKKIIYKPECQKKILKC